MRIVHISDTHRLHAQLDVPAGEVLVHSGDFCEEGLSLDDYRDFFAWFESLPHQYKVLVAGNHDDLLDVFPRTLRKRIPKNVIYLEDSGVDIQGVKFWGSPWTLGIVPMPFTYIKLEKSKSRWDDIPLDTQVLVTHGPPYGILDKTYSGQHIGDDDLRTRVKLVRPKLHLFGHVHESVGRMERWGTTFLNSSVGDDRPGMDLRMHVVELQSTRTKSS